MSTDHEAMALRRLVTALQRYVYQFATEAELHSSIATVLNGEGIAFEHEFVAGPKDRFDFLVHPGFVIEAKIKGSLVDALRQCKRYAERDDVRAVILVTTRYWGRSDIREIADINSKPVRLLKLRGASF